MSPSGVQPQPQSAPFGGEHASKGQLRPSRRHDATQRPAAQAAPEPLLPCRRKKPETSAPTQRPLQLPPALLPKVSIDAVKG